jgi:hypothetical protein
MGGSGRGLILGTSRQLCGVIKENQGRDSQNIRFACWDLNSGPPV